MKKIKKIFGFNIGNFKEQEITIGNNTGIQWDNGFGKTYLIIQYLISLSPRLRYDFNKLPDNTKETKFLAELKLSTDENNMLPEDKLKSLFFKLKQLFNQNDNKHFYSLSGILFKDNNNFYITITYPEDSNLNYPYLHYIKK